MPFADNELESREQYPMSPSWRQRGYRPLAGLEDPDCRELRRRFRASGTGTFEFRPASPEATCECGELAGINKQCYGGLFECLDHLRREDTPHTDYKCCACGRVWTDWVPR